VSEPTTKLSAEDWRAMFANAAKDYAWFLDKYDLAEDVQPDEVDAVIRADALAEVAAAVEGLEPDCHTDDGWYHQGDERPCSAVDRAAVLRLLKEKAS
jgi:hypothetical protein